MAMPIGHLEQPRALAHAGRLLAVGGVRSGPASQITLYDVVAGKPARTVEVPAHVLGLAASGASFVAACADGVLRVISSATGKIEREIAAHRGACTAVAIHGTTAITAGEDGAVRAFSLADGKRTREHLLSRRALRAVAVDATGAVFAAAGDDGIVRVVEGADGVPRQMPGHDGVVSALAFTPAADRLVSGGEDGTVRIWFLVGPIDSEVRGAGESGHAGGALALMFLPGETEVGSERLVSCGADGRLKVWRMNERRRPRTFELGSRPCTALAWVPRREGGELFAAGDDRTVRAIPFDEKGTPTERGHTSYEHGFDVFEEALRSPAKPRRIEATKALAALDEPEALELVIRALASDRDAEVRVLAAVELGKRARSGAREALRARLDDVHATVRNAAFQALRTIEADAPLSPIRAALGSRYPDMRTAAVEALPALVRVSPLAALLIAERLADPDRSVRKAAFQAVVQIEPPGSPAPLRVAFERGTADVRAEALARVAEARQSAAPDFAPLVEKALDDEDPSVRRVSFTALALTRPVLARWLASHDPWFERALADLAQRAAGIGIPAEPTAAAVAKSRATLLPAAPASDRAPDETEREPLLAALTCRTPDTALRGARGLALLGDLRALGALLPLSRETDPELRREAAEALSVLQDSRARRRLAWMLNDPDASVRDTALQCLGRVESTPLDVAERALQSAQEDIRSRGLVVLVAHGKGTEAGEALLAHAIDDEASKVRSEAFRTLWAWHGGSPLVAIDRALEGRFPDVRKRATDELLALAKAEDGKLRPAAIERLVATIPDRDEGVARAAYAAVLEVEGKPYAKAHHLAMASTEAAVRVAGARGARDAAPDDVRSDLIRLVEDPEPAVRGEAVDSLDQLYPTDPGPLRSALATSHLDTRVTAADRLAARRDKTILAPMLALLRDPDLAYRFPPGVVAALRQGAAVALATLGSRDLLEPYANELVKDEDGGVREQGARGLSNACSAEDAPYLVALLGHADLAVRSWAGEGLARLGDPRGVPVLTGTLRHPHDPIRVGAILAFAALGPEGYGGLLQGFEDPSLDVQRILLSVVLARDLRAYRRGEPPELLSSALSSVRPEIRFAAARAIELRMEPGTYLRHLVDVLLPDKPEKPADLAKWPDEEDRNRRMVGLAFALAGELPEQRYAALQTLRLRDRPLEYFREAARTTRLQPATAAWIPETTPRMPVEDRVADPVKQLRRLFATVGEGEPREVSPAGRQHLWRVAFGAYVGLLRQVGPEDGDGHRVRRDVIERVTSLVLDGSIERASALPALARSLDDPNHLVRRAAFAALKRVYEGDPETPLGIALLSSSADVLRSALDDLAARGEGSFARISKALDSPVADARRYAFEVLERVSPKGSLEPLLAALRSRHADLRIGVLERLATSRDPRVEEALASALASDHDDLRLRAAELLAARRSDLAVGVLEAALRSDTGVDRAREALARLGTSAAVAALGRRLAEPADAGGPSPGERAALIASLGDSRNSAAIDVLGTAFADTESLALRAFEMAMRLAGPRADAVPERGAPPPKPRDPKLAMRACEAAARAKLPAVRRAAARELDLIDHPNAGALLQSLFTDRDREVRVTAVNAYADRVEQKGADPAPLDEVLRGGARETMLGAARGLAAKQVATAFRALLLFVRAGADGERETALLALGAQGDPRALPELELVAAGGTEEAPVEPSMQAAAVEALGRLVGRLTDPEARERVRDRIEAALGRGALATAAVRALGHIGGERARARLEGVLASGADDEQREAAIALGRLGDPASERPLAEALNHWDDSVRWAARDALGKLFPNDRTRIELHAVVSDQQDLAAPAAAFLAAEGDARALLAVLGSLESDTLREQLRMGLVLREQVPVADLAAMLASDSVLARSDAAWVAGARAGRLGASEGLGPALVEAARRSEREESALADDANASQLNTAWLHAIWAGRRVAPELLRPVAAGVVQRTDAPLAVRIEAAHALAGTGDPALAVALASSELELRSAAAAAAGTPNLPMSPPDPVVLGRAGAPVPPGAVADTLGRQIHLPKLLRLGQVAELVALARSGPDRERFDAIAALGRATTDEAAEALVTLAASGDTEPVRKAAFRASKRLQRTRRQADRRQAEPRP